MNIVYIFITIFSISSLSYASWKVDCDNYCFFSEFSNNCQGVYYHKNPVDNQTKVYTTWNSQYQGCLANDISLGVSKLLKPKDFSCNCKASTSSPPSNKYSSILPSTLEKLKVLRAKVHSWTLCAPDPNTINPIDNLLPLDWTDIKSCQEERLSGGDSTHFFKVGLCKSGQGPFEDPSQCRYDGDMANTLTSHCLIGMEDSCSEIRKSQDRSTGAWYRNPYLKRFPLSPTFQPLFSRDQLQGALSYWIRKRDKVSLLKWLRFVKKMEKLLLGVQLIYIIYVHRDLPDQDLQMCLLVIGILFCQMIDALFLISLGE